MAANSPIEWTDHTWSPWEGCTKVSPGCDHCYAEGMNRWLRKGANWGPRAPRRTYSDDHWDKLRKWNDRAAAAGRFDKVFPSVCDPFDNEAPEAERLRFAVAILSMPNLIFLLLTKRIGNAAAMLAEMFPNGTPDNVWIGATIVNKEEADRDIPKLLATPARVRFLSMEPLLGPVDLTHCRNGDRHFDALGSHGLGGIDWVICGGESGPHARPMHPDWARSLRDQCAAAGVPFLFKQWGEWAADECQGPNVWRHLEVPRARLVVGEWKFEAADSGWPDDENMMFKLGKKAAGRLLDGVTHDGFPEVTP